MREEGGKEEIKGEAVSTLAQRELIVSIHNWANMQRVSFWCL
jgi:hypothetical protein